MKIRLLQCLFACTAFLQGIAAAAGPDQFGFAVIAHPFKKSSDDSILRETIAKTDKENLAFVVVTGLKAAAEPCSDAFFKERKELLDSAKNGLIVALAASDWASCKHENGQSSAIGRLNQLRDLLFADEFSLGDTKVPVMRQSEIVKFRGYPENTRWEFANVMFATLNLPANNNNYLSAAGRNSEFEDRLIANRDWLNRVFSYAQRKKLKGIVIFSDGNPLTRTPKIRGRDGFNEIRRHLTTLAAKFPGQVLLIHDQVSTQTKAFETIQWHGNIGVLDIESHWVKLTVNRPSSMLFTIENTAPPVASERR